MNNKDSRIIIENHQRDFLYQKSQSNLNITFNRITFIFFIFFIISLIYSIHLIHLGSRKAKTVIDYKIKTPINKLYRADIVDRNGILISRNINSSHVAVVPKLVTNKKKFLIKLRLNFP